MCTDVCVEKVCVCRAIIFVNKAHGTYACIPRHIHQRSPLNTSTHPLTQLRAAFNAIEAAYKAVTDKEKAEVVALGGLHVVGTERHESRRIDNQLRGRSGRQGDPGSTRYAVGGS